MDRDDKQAEVVGTTDGIENSGPISRLFRAAKNSTQLTTTLAIAGIMATIVVGAITAYYPAPWDLIFGKKIRVKGPAIDAAPQNEDYPHSFDELYTYEVTEGHLLIGLKTIRVEFTLKAKHKDGTIQYGKVKGKGRYISDVGYILYDAYNAGRSSETWSGVMLLNVTNEGPIKGYFLTENTLANGRFLMGTLTLERADAI